MILVMWFISFVVVRFDFSHLDYEDDDDDDDEEEEP